MRAHRQALFGDRPDLLADTLADAGQAVSRCAVHLGNGTQVERVANGVLWIRPPHPFARQAIISAGIHGNETAPIEVLNRLVNELLDEKWQPELAVLVVLGNPQAMVAGQRFMDFNLNRLFRGTHAQTDYQGSKDAARAGEIEHCVRAFVQPSAALVHYDLHTAIRPSRREKFALYPFVPERPQPPAEQIDFLLESEVSTLLLQHKAASTFSSHTALGFDAESFTIELGKVRPFGQNDLSRFRGIENSLRRLMQGHRPRPADGASPIRVFEVVHEILNSGDDFRFHIPDDVANFTEYAPGTLIWEDGRDSYRVGETAEVIVFPNRQVPVGQRVGLMARIRRSDLGMDF